MENTMGRGPWDEAFKKMGKVLVHTSFSGEKPQLPSYKAIYRVVFHSIYNDFCM